MKFLVFIEQRDGKIRKASLEALSLAPQALRRPGRGGHRRQGRHGARQGPRQVRRRHRLRRRPGRARALLEQGLRRRARRGDEEGEPRRGPDRRDRDGQGRRAALRRAPRRLGAGRRHGPARRGGPSRRLAARLLGQGARRGGLRRGEAPDRDDAARMSFPAEAEDGAPEPRGRGARARRRSRRARRSLRVEASESKELDVSEADIIVSGGRGIKGPENWPARPRPPAGARRARSAPRAPSWTRAGSTTSTRSARPARSCRRPSTSPCGISGAIQHLAGMGTLQGHRRDQQGPRGADLQGRDLRRRRRPLPDRPGVRQSRPRREGGVACISDVASAAVRRSPECSESPSQPNRELEVSD